MAITYEFLVRKGGDAEVIASVTNDAGKVTWEGNPDTVAGIQRMIDEAGFNLSDPAQLPLMGDRFGRGSYFTAAPADR